MNVAWLHDQGNADGSRGGAELTMDEFRAAAPESVEFTDLKAAETVVIGNCVTVDPGIIPALIDRRVIRYHHDLAQHESLVLRSWLDENAEHIFTSPLHREHYGLDGAVAPPAVDLDRFRPNRQTRRNTERQWRLLGRIVDESGQGRRTSWLSGPAGTAQRSSLSASGPSLRPVRGSAPTAPSRRASCHRFSMASSSSSSCRLQ